MKRSLHTHLLVSANISLAVLLLLAGWLLYAVYADKAHQLRKERLQAIAFSLIASAETDDKGTLHLTYIIPAASGMLSEYSGLYAQIVNHSGSQAWYSPSLRTLDLTFAEQVEAGQMRFSEITSSRGERFAGFSIGINWAGAGSADSIFTVSVAEPTAILDRHLRTFRNQLMAGLLIAAAVIILIQHVILSRALSPLRKLHDELKNMDAGKQASINGAYPQELSDIAVNINALIQSRQQIIDRNRHALADLAHSLKTPLAVLRNIWHEHRPEESEAIIQQLERMENQIDYQLNQAATAGRQTTGTGVLIAPVADKIVEALLKVYQEQNVRISNQIESKLVFLGDEGDLYELLGNVLDNACKYGATKIELKGNIDIEKKKLILITVDDGPGIADEYKQRLLSRGTRLHENVPGQGIGLAVVKGIVDVYQGDMYLQDSSPHGLTVRLELPNG